MCGITGFLDFNGHSTNENIREMINVLRHRGPDDSGVNHFTLGNKIHGVIGFNRLSILDTSQAGHQPMPSPDGKVILALNGEVYNAFDYKKELEGWGYKFRGTSDTELVLALYLKYGLNTMLEKLNGMYTIVIIDLRIDRIYCIRDKYGIKPFYYVYNNKIFAFASEYKSFKYLADFEFNLNYDNLSEYFLFRYNVSGTLVKDINVLESGYYLEFRPESGLQKRCYFDVNHYERANACVYAFEHYKEMLLQILGKAVKYQLISDVKLGCQLSGGIDSSLITYLANKIDESKTFESVSIIFDDNRYSEECYIDALTKQIDIVSHKFRMDAAYYAENFEKAAWHFEAPINHPNSLGIYLLAQQAKKYVTVLLSGEGADEVFGGYGLFNNIEHYLNPKVAARYLKRFLPESMTTLSYLSAENRAVLQTAFMTPVLARLVFPNFDLCQAMVNRKDIYKKLSGSTFDKQVKYEMKTYLVDLLIRQDKMSMAHSIENRVPFLDYDVVKTSFDIPERFLFNGKKLLKEIVAGIMGRDFAYRPKNGFSIPLREFFKNKTMEQYLYDKILPGIKSRQIMNYENIQKWTNNISSIRSSELEALWIAFSLETFASLYL